MAKISFTPTVYDHRTPPKEIVVTAPSALQSSIIAFQSGIIVGLILFTLI